MFKSGTNFQLLLLIVSHGAIFLNANLKKILFILPVTLQVLAKATGYQFSSQSAFVSLRKGTLKLDDE